MVPASTGLNLPVSQLVWRWLVLRGRMLVSLGFTWIQPGQSSRYLGFHIGIGISPAQQFDPVLGSIRRKVCHWSSSHLSLASRALIVNQVLLATAWCITSCWMLHSGVAAQLRRLVWNFLWAGSNGSPDTRVKWY